MNQTQIQVIGVKEALKEINRINPALRREITRDYKRIVAPAVKQIAGSVPSLPPISGMGQSWTPSRPAGRRQVTIQAWDKGEFGRSILAKINTRRPRPSALGNEVSAAFRIVVRSGWALAADMAGRRGGGSTVTGANMIRGLRGRYGDASRFVWPSWFQAFPEVEKNMIGLVDRIMREVGQRLQVRGS